MRRATFEELFRSDKLPSGHEFELMPDTVGIGLKVSEIDEKVAWKKKAAQAGIVTASVSGHDIQAMKPKDRVSFFGAMLDTDVMFLSMAWLAQTNDMSIKLDPTADVACPSCNSKFTSIPFGNIGVMCRDVPAGGPDAMSVVDVPPDLLVGSLQSGQLLTIDPIWMAARGAVPESSWSDHNVIRLNRVGAALRFRRGSEEIPRSLSRKAEFETLRMKVIETVSDSMDSHIPYMERTFTLECKACGVEVSVPFDQGM